TQAPQDISSQAMRQKQQAVNAIVLRDPDVSHTVAFVGAANGSTGNNGTVFVTLKPYAQRKSTPDQIIARLRPKLAEVPGVTLFLQSVQDVRIGGRASRTQYQYTLVSADLAALREWAPRVLERLRKIPQLKDVNTDQQTAGLQISVI